MRNTAAAPASRCPPRLASLLAGALLLVLAPSAWTQEEAPILPGTLWNGTHVGVGASGGPAFLSNDSMREAGGFALGVRATTALTMQVVHFELFYTHTELTAVVGGDPFAASGNAIGAAVGVHPLFLANLFANRLGYMLASLYVGVGLSAEFTSSDWRGDALDEAWELGTHIGAGLDVPIDSADDGSGWWGGFQYWFSNVPSSSGALGGDEGMEGHALLFGVAYRINDFPLF